MAELSEVAALLHTHDALSKHGETFPNLKAHVMNRLIEIEADHGQKLEPEPETEPVEPDPPAEPGKPQTQAEAEAQHNHSLRQARIHAVRSGKAPPTPEERKQLDAEPEIDPDAQVEEEVE